METNVSLDLGKNVTDLLTKLATSLGTTVEKIYPFYIKQVQVSAIVDMVLCFTMLMLCLVLFIFAKNKIKSWSDKEFGVYNVIVLFVLTLSGVVSLVTTINLSEWVTAITNPEYAALRLIIADCGKLLGK